MSSMVFLLSGGLRFGTAQHIFSTVFTHRWSSSQVFAMQEKLSDYLEPPLIAGRPFLADSHISGLPQLLCPARPEFPLRLNSAKLKVKSKAFAQLGRELSHTLQQALLRNGAVLLDADLGMRNERDLSQFVQGLSWTVQKHSFSLAVRNKECEEVYSASDEPPEVTIEPHNEFCYTKHMTSKIGFFSVQPAELGGETALCDVREVWSKLDKNIIDRLWKEGIRYYSFFEHNHVEGKYKSWQEALGVNSCEAAEKLLLEHGYEWEWQDEGLCYWIDLPATRPHPVTGEELWTNQAHAAHKSYFQTAHSHFIGRQVDSRKYPFTTFYCNWDEIEPEVLHHIRRVMWNCAVGFVLQAGELLLLDNYYVQHARLGFRGNRKVVTTLFG